ALVEPTQVGIGSQDAAPDGHGFWRSNRVIAAPRPRRPRRSLPVAPLALRSRPVARQFEPPDPRSRLECFSLRLACCHPPSSITDPVAIPWLASSQGTDYRSDRPARSQSS